MDVNLNGEIIGLKGNEKVVIRMREEVLLPNEL